MTKEYVAIGLMSGTSLDGMDVAYCRFEENDGLWEYEILEATTLPYDEKWLDRLSNAPALSALDMTQLDNAYGHYIGQAAVKFLKRHSIKPDLIASHGHTVFHQPDKGFTLQIGCGSAICSYLQFPVICDFRSLDVALGGQGAPLVPIGDQLLFGDYGACLNLGGIANISCDDRGVRMAWDICPVNMPLNLLTSEISLPYDDKGQLASSGTLIPQLLESLNKLEFYTDLPPKSTGREWFKKAFLPILENFNEHPLEDRLHTVISHIAIQLAAAIPPGTKNVLVTGGGTHNEFLIERLKAQTEAEIIIPSDLLIDFKEALIFGFLGVLRLRNEVNCLASVTGASTDSCGGAIYFS